MKIKVKEVHRSGKKGNPKGKTKNTSKLGNTKRFISEECICIR